MKNMAEMWQATSSMSWRHLSDDSLSMKAKLNSPDVLKI